MGVYDVVVVPCPVCGYELDFQSKSGPCLLDYYDLHNAPVEVLADVNRHAPIQCKCGAWVMVQLEYVVNRRAIVVPASGNGES